MCACMCACMCVHIHISLCPLTTLLTFYKPSFNLDNWMNTERLYGESMEIRDLETRGPWAVASKRSEDATKGPRVSKSLDEPYNWFRLYVTLVTSVRSIRFQV